MNKPEAPEPPAAVILTVNTIHNGKFIPAGSETPYTETTLPDHLKQYRATGDEMPFTPAARDIYATPLPSPFPPLREDVREQVESAHQRRMGVALAQAEAAQRFRDAAYEQAAAAAQPPQLYVKRGGEMGRVERAKLKPGEHVFALRPNGEYESVGIVDSRGELPPQELII